MKKRNHTRGHRLRPGAEPRQPHKYHHLIISVTIIAAAAATMVVCVVVGAENNVAHHLAIAVLAERIAGLHFED